MDYSKLSDRDLIDAAFERLSLKILPLYLDDNAARLMRDRIAEIKLTVEFREVLYRLTVAHLLGGCFTLMQATPRQQTIAALQALDAKEKP